MNILSVVLLKNNANLAQLKQIETDLRVITSLLGLINQFKIQIVYSILFLFINMHFRLLIIFTLLSPFFTQALDVKVHTLPVQSELRASAISGKLIRVAGNKNTIYKSLNKGRTWINSGFKPNKNLISET